MSLNRILSQRPDVAWKEVDGQVILMDLGIEKRVHRLNTVGSFIWKNIDGVNTLEAILDSVCDEFEVDKSVAEEDIVGLVEKLEDLGVALGS